MRGDIKRNEFLIFAGVWITLAFFYHSGGHNEAARFDSIRSFLETGRFYIDSYAQNSGDTILYDGHVYSGKAPGTMYFGLLPFAVVKAVFTCAGVSENVKYHLVCYFTTIFTISLFSALAAVYLYRFLFALTNNHSEAILFTLIIDLGTMCLPFGSLFFSHQLTASLLFLSFYNIFRWHQLVDEGNGARYLVIAGLTGGLAVVSEYPAAIGLFWTSLYALYVFAKKRKLSASLVYFVSVGLGFIPLFLYNYLAFDKLFYVPYEAYAQPGSPFTAHSEGFLGVRNPITNDSFLPTLTEITVKPLRGLFWTSPVLLFVVPGFVLAAREALKARRFPVELFLSAALFISYLIFNANYGNDPIYWGGGYSFGPRHIIPALPFLALPLWYAYKVQWIKPVLLAAAMVSVFICFMAIAVEPRLSFDYVNPIVNFLLPRYLTGRYGLSRVGIFSDQAIFGNTVSFNLGKALGLTGVFELLPLGAFWLFCAWWAGRKNKGFPSRFLCVFIAVVFLAPLLNHLFAKSEDGKTGLVGRYYSNQNFNGPPSIVQRSENLFFDWSRIAPLEPPFSAEWSGKISILKKGNHVVCTISDDASWVWLAGQPVVNNEGIHDVKKSCGSVKLSPGEHHIRVRYINYQGRSEMKILWKQPGGVEGPVPSEILK